MDDLTLNRQPQIAYCASSQPLWKAALQALGGYSTRGVIISSDDMNGRLADHGLEFLPAFNGRIHHLEKGYRLKFEITRVEGHR